jgi:small GTP-binding protein
VDTRKICILGDFAVGKTSLVNRFVHDRFSDRYHTSVGVRVDTKQVVAPDGRPLKLVIWDVAGIENPTELFLRYLRGSAGYLLVADGTRRETLDRAMQLRRAVESHLAVLPFVGLINKADLASAQEVGTEQISRLEEAGGIWLRTSALSGARVEEAFDLLLRAIEAGG